MLMGNSKNCSKKYVELDRRHFWGLFFIYLFIIILLVKLKLYSTDDIID